MTEFTIKIKTFGPNSYLISIEGELEERPFRHILGSIYDWTKVKNVGLIENYSYDIGRHVRCKTLEAAVTGFFRRAAKDIALVIATLKGVKNNEIGESRMPWEHPERRQS